MSHTRRNSLSHAPTRHNPSHSRDLQGVTPRPSPVVIYKELVKRGGISFDFPLGSSFVVHLDVDFGLSTLGIDTILTAMERLRGEGPGWLSGMLALNTTLPSVHPAATPGLDTPPSTIPPPNTSLAYNTLLHSPRPPPLVFDVLLYRLLPLFFSVTLLITLTVILTFTLYLKQPLPSHFILGTVIVLTCLAFLGWSGWLWRYLRYQAPSRNAARDACGPRAQRIEGWRVNKADIAEGKLGVPLEELPTRQETTGTGSPAHAKGGLGPSAYYTPDTQPGPRTSVPPTVQPPHTYEPSGLPQQPLQADPCRRERAHPYPPPPPSIPPPLRRNTSTTRLAQRTLPPYRYASHRSSAQRARTMGHQRPLPTPADWDPAPVIPPVRPGTPSPGVPSFASSSDG
ncbi:MAG: hypothetical protein M1839_002936 [Geoglossum umbratile]|nr:MAG: hypothetical protein M1839_002936 [Geoglossum umbratile]